MPVQLPEGTTPTCRHRVAYFHRLRSCHCHRCYAPLPWRCPSETKTEAPSVLSRILWTYLKMLWFSETFFSAWLLLPTHCRRKELLLHLITFSDKNTHSVETPGRGIGPLQGHLTVQHTKFTRHKYPCPRRDSNPHFQQENGGRPTPWTTGSPGSELRLSAAIK